MTVKKLAMLLITIILSSCQDRCISPGEGINTSTTNLFIPVSRDEDPQDISKWWIYSGVEIEISESFPLTVSGTINLCDSGKYECKDNPNCKEILVPASFCVDGSIPSYSRGSTDSRVICPGGKGQAFNQRGGYVDSNIEVNPEDLLYFRLVPQYIEVSHCRQDPNLGNYLHGDLRDKTLQILNPENVCNKGASALISGTNFEIKKQLGTSHKFYVGNDFTPYNNKLYLYGNNSPWIETALVDIREIPISGRHGEYDHNCSPSTTQLRQYNSYDVNYRCNNICDKGKFSQDCIVTLTKDWFSSGKNRRSTSIDLQDPETLKNPTEVSKEYANLLIVKIGNDNKDYAADGEQCFPSNQRGPCMNQAVEESSLELNKSHRVHKQVPPNSKVMLGIKSPTGDYSSNIGGYHVQVQKHCTKSDAKGLYLYIGDTAPDNIRPGDPATYEVVTATEIIKDGTTKKPFIVNGGTGNNGNPPKAGKIYFAIKDANTSDTVKNIRTSGVNPNPDNGYRINMVRSIWTPNVSELFTSIRDYLLSVFYGKNFDMAKIGDTTHTSKNTEKGLVQTFHENVISKGLGQMIQAVLVLYIATSSMAFIMGLMRSPKTELIMRMIKVFFIAGMLDATVWKFLTESLFSLFLAGSDEMLGNIANVTGGDKSFRFLDYSLGAFMASETWLRMLSLITSGVIGFIMFFLVIWGIYMFISGILSAMIMYLLNIIGMAILMALSPLFLTFMLFERTKVLFQSWIKLMTAFALKPIFVFSSISMLNQLMMRAFYEINNFQACTQCWFFFVIKISDYEADNTGFCVLKTLMPHGYLHDSSIDKTLADTYTQIDGMGFFGMPFHAAIAIIFVTTALAISKFVTMAEDLSKSITGTMFDVYMAASNAGQALLSVVGLDRDTQSIIKSASKQSQAHAQKTEFKHKPRETSKNLASAPVTTGGNTSGADDGQPSSSDKGDESGSVRFLAGEGPALGTESQPKADGESESQPKANGESEPQPRADGESEPQPRATDDPDIRSEMEDRTTKPDNDEPPVDAGTNSDDNKWGEGDLFASRAEDSEVPNSDNAAQKGTDSQNTDPDRGQDDEDNRS